MRRSFLLLSAVVFSGATPAQEVGSNDPPNTSVTSIGHGVSHTATIQLGFPIFFAAAVAPPPTPPITIARGTRLQLMAPSPGSAHGPVQWFKDGKPLPATPETLEIVSVVSGDSGIYSASIKNSEGRAMFSDGANVLVSRGGQKLLNFSVRGRIDAGQPTLISGLVIQPGPVGTLVLIRAIGPALANFGVAAPLASPQLHLYDDRGRAVTPYENQFLTLAVATDRVGAFALPAATKDVAQLFFLSGGAYSVQLSSAAGGSGTALLEIYEIPL